jgi:hypothetical protein
MEKLNKLKNNKKKKKTQEHRYAIPNLPSPRRFTTYILWIIKCPNIKLYI